MPPHMYRQVLHKALASEVRRQILLALRDKPLYLSEISQIVGKKPQTVDFHLGVLKEIGLVSSQWKEGKKYYALTDKNIIRFLEQKGAVPPKFHPKPPHEIVREAWKDLSSRMDRIEKKVDELLSRSS